MGYPQALVRSGIRRNTPINEVLRLAKRKNSICQMLRAPARTCSQREKGATDYKLTDAIFSKLR